MLADFEDEKRHSKQHALVDVQEHDTSEQNKKHGMIALGHKKFPLYPKFRVCFVFILCRTSTSQIKVETQILGIVIIHHNLSRSGA